MARLIGFQLASLSGENIQGDNDDPTNLRSFEVMSFAIASKVMRQLGSRKFLLMPIYEGDVEEPVIVRVADWRSDMLTDT